MLKIIISVRVGWWLNFLWGKDKGVMGGGVLKVEMGKGDLWLDVKWMNKKI